MILVFHHKVLIGNNSISWGTTCTTYYSKSAFNDDKSVVYTLQNLNNIVLLNAFNVLDGSVSGTRYYSLNYASTEMCINVKSSKVYFGYYSSSSYFFLILDLTSSTFSNFEIATVNKIFDIGFVPSDGR